MLGKHFHKQRGRRLTWRPVWSHWVWCSVHSAEWLHSVSPSAFVESYETARRDVDVNNITFMVTIITILVASSQLSECKMQIWIIIIKIMSIKYIYSIKRNTTYPSKSTGKFSFFVFVFCFFFILTVIKTNLGHRIYFQCVRIPKQAGFDLTLCC